jgi:hypothetical protein
MAYQNTIRLINDGLLTIFAEVDSWFDKPAVVRAYSPRHGGWNIDRILEHITLTNHYLMLIIRKGCAKAHKRAIRQTPDVAGESDLRMLAPIGQRGSFLWVRPAHMEPTGTATSSDIRDLLERQQAECLGLLHSMSCGEGSLYRVRMSVNDCGKMDMYQWLYFVAMHAQRHLAQMTANEVDCEQAGMLSKPKGVSTACNSTSST